MTPAEGCLPKNLASPRVEDEKIVGAIAAHCALGAMAITYRTRTGGAFQKQIHQVHFWEHPYTR